MNKITFSFVIIIVTSITCLAQSDSLSLFRTPSKNNPNAGSNAGVSGNNAITVSIAHLGRGGTMLTYERYFNRTPLSVFVGLGFTKIDYIGQYSFDEERYYYASIYTERKSADFGRMFELGVKYLVDEELGGNYFGFCFSNYTNKITQQVKDEYEVPVFKSSSYELDYDSKEFKFTYGITNDVSERFYSDFNFGAGFRFIAYDQLQILENYVPSVYNQYAYDTELLISKKNYNDIKPWLFCTWKIGVRF